MYGKSIQTYHVSTEMGEVQIMRNQKKRLFLPRVTNVDHQNFLAELHDLVMPNWAINFVTSDYL